MNASIELCPGSPKCLTPQWIEGRRYLGLEVLKRSRITTVPDSANATEEVSTNDIPALSA